MAIKLRYRNLTLAISPFVETVFVESKSEGGELFNMSLKGWNFGNHKTLLGTKRAGSRIVHFGLVWKIQKSERSPGSGWGFKNPEIPEIFS